jgi:hypothetical protein
MILLVVTETSKAINEVAGSYDFEAVFDVAEDLIYG